MGRTKQREKSPWTRLLWSLYRAEGPPTPGQGPGAQATEAQQTLAAAHGQDASSQACDSPAQAREAKLEFRPLQLAGSIRGPLETSPPAASPTSKGAHLLP